jgi:hypothetical protein
MVSVIGLDSDKVQLLCDAANEEVDQKDKVQIANYLCPVRLILLMSIYMKISLYCYCPSNLVIGNFDS